MKKTLSYILAFLLLFTLLYGLTHPANAANPTEYDEYWPPKTTGTIEATYIHNGVERSYILYIPEKLRMNAPLVIGMHGYTSSPWTFKNNFGWDKLADEHNFIVCYPQGSYDAYNSYSHWNARLKLSTVDDVGFISDLALYLADEYHLDKNRIFTMGFSNGGYMSYTLACERPDVFRAAASVSGLMSEYTWESYNPNDLTPEQWLKYMPSTPIPICQIHGTYDYIVPIDGSEYLPPFYSGISAQDTVEFWAGINECTQKEVSRYTKNVTATHYTNPQNDVEVWYYEYNGWSHYWPSKNYHVNIPSEINAQEIIWEFFSMYE